MNMHFIDWAIVAALLIALSWGAYTAKRYTNSVTAFLAADRCGGRYLISVANGMAQLGVITMLVFFQIHYDVGFAGFWWGLLNEPAFMIMAITGWVVFRFRQTRALTLAQFFEMRYSKNFRIFSGLVAFLAGILNFGIFPSIGAKFFISLCNLPETFGIVGTNLHISTFLFIMAMLLTISIIFTFLGGQIAIMITDFIQGTFTNIVFVVVVLFLLLSFSKTQIAETVLVSEPGRSLVNPFDMGAETNFNPIYFVIGVITIFYGAMGWQGTAGYNCAAKNAHETKMAGMLGVWRWRVMLPIIFVMVPVSVHVYMDHHDYSGKAAALHRQLDERVDLQLKELANSRSDNKEDYQFLAGLDASQTEQLLSLTNIEEDQVTASDTLNIPGLENADPKESWRLARLLKDKTGEVKSQTRIPLVLGKILPTGLLGLFCAAMLAAFISTHDTYLHSWGSMLVQDVILPFKKKAVEPKTHLWLFRASILAVAVYIFIFSIYFRHAQRIIMYCNITATVFIGGAGAVIIGGLYWKRATAAGAWTAMITGLTLSLTGTLVTQAKVSAVYAAQKTDFWIGVTETLAKINCDQIFWRIAEVLFSTTAQVMTFWVYTVCITLFIVVSLLTSKKAFNMNKMLHRKEYAVEGEESASIVDAETIWQKLGFSKDFTRMDYFIAIITVVWPIIWMVIFVSVNIFHKRITDRGWFEYWYCWVWVIFVLMVVFTVWFTIGGFKDIGYLFKKLKSYRASELDDGRVVEDNNDDADTESE